MYYPNICYYRTTQNSKDKTQAYFAPSFAKSFGEHGKSFEGHGPWKKEPCYNKCVPQCVHQKSHGGTCIWSRPFIQGDQGLFGGIQGYDKGNAELKNWVEIGDLIHLFLPNCNL